MSLDHATIIRLAHLARIRLDANEAASLAAELDGILGWVAQLNEIDVDGVEPLTGPVRLALRMRDDVVTDGDRRDALLSNAPDRVGSFFAVPKVVE